MILYTDRLVLRPWRRTDACHLYEYARDERVGLPAGWPPHNSVENSAEIIRTVFSDPLTFAVHLRSEGRAVGCIGLMTGDGSNIPLEADECEIGYWIGVPYWGQGLIPEAARELIRYAFDELEVVRLWGGHYDGNDKSRRVLEKCGFVFRRTETGKLCALLGELRTEHIYSLDREAWRRSRTPVSL